MAYYLSWATDYLSDSLSCVYLWHEIRQIIGYGITRNLCYVISQFCGFPCRWRCPQGRAEQYITFFLYAVKKINYAVFGCIPRPGDKLFKMLEKCGLWKKKVFWFLCGAIYGMPGSHFKGRTLRVIGCKSVWVSTLVFRVGQIIVSPSKNMKSYGIGQRIECKKRSKIYCSKKLTIGVSTLKVASH
jgi:hypothetical protein